MERPSRHEIMMDVARTIARRGTCLRAQVGAVVAYEGRILTTGYNGPMPQQDHCDYAQCDVGRPCVRAVHAEMNAILFAAKHGIELNGGTLYCTHGPCLECARAIIQAGIDEVHFETPYRDDSGLKLLADAEVVWEKIYITSINRDDDEIPF